MAATWPCSTRAPASAGSARPSRRTRHASTCSCPTSTWTTSRAWASSTACTATASRCTSGARPRRPCRCAPGSAATSPRPCSRSASGTCPASWCCTTWASSPSTSRGFRVTCSLVSHPAPTVGYRLEADGVVLTYLSDHEPALGVRSLPQPAGVDLRLRPRPRRRPAHPRHAVHSDGVRDARRVGPQHGGSGGRLRGRGRSEGLRAVPLRPDPRRRHPRRHAGGGDGGPRRTVPGGPGTGRRHRGGHGTGRGPAGRPSLSRRRTSTPSGCRGAHGPHPGVPQGRAGGRGLPGRRCLRAPRAARTRSCGSTCAGRRREQLHELADELGLHELAVEDALERAPAAQARPLRHPPVPLVPRRAASTTDAGRARRDRDRRVHQRALADHRPQGRRLLDRAGAASAGTARPTSPSTASASCSTACSTWSSTATSTPSSASTSTTTRSAKASSPRRPLEPSQQRHWFQMRQALVRFHRLVVPMREAVSGLMRREHSRRRRGPLPVLPGRLRPRPAGRASRPRRCATWSARSSRPT